MATLNLSAEEYRIGFKFFSDALDALSCSVPKLSISSSSMPEKNFTRFPFIIFSQSRTALSGKLRVNVVLSVSFFCILDRCLKQ